MMVWFKRIKVCTSLQLSGLISFQAEFCEVQYTLFLERWVEYHPQYHLQIRFSFNLNKVKEEQDYTASSRNTDTIYLLKYKTNYHFSHAG